MEILLVRRPLFLMYSANGKGGGESEREKGENEEISAQDLH